MNVPIGSLLITFDVFKLSFSIPAIKERDSLLITFDVFKYII